MPILLIGLGNPGSEYAATRHNVGFLTLDRFTEQHALSWKFDKRAKAEIAEANIAGKKIILAKPQTFMNLSGTSAASLAERFKVTPHDIWAVYDDVDLAVGQIRVRLGGSAGGHNGVKSLIEHLGEQFWRIRLGIGTPPERVPLEDYVLQRFTMEEQAIIKHSITTVVEHLNTKLDSGLAETTLSQP